MNEDRLAAETVKEREMKLHAANELAGEEREVRQQ